jgi:hypothetical protein
MDYNQGREWAFTLGDGQIPYGGLIAGIVGY